MSVEGQPPIHIEAVDPGGYGISYELQPVGSATGGIPEGWTGESDPEITDVTRIVVPADMSAYVNLFWTDGSAQMFLSRLHPAVQIPQSRRYAISGRPCPRCGWARRGPLDAINVLAEVSLDPLPLVEDTDVVPFADLQPIKLMNQALWHFESGEPDAGLKYQQMAVSWMKANEAKEDLRQGPPLINSALECSGAGISDYCANL